VQDEPEPVWQAIYDQYKPVSMDDSIPRNRVGQIVSLADRLDTLRGCFSVGMIPSGSRDPFALRRAAQGVVKILVEGKLELPLLDLLRDGSEQVPANESIRAREVRYVSPDGTDEVMPTAAALRKAQALGLDLVLIAPHAFPPVAKACERWQAAERSSDSNRELISFFADRVKFYFRDHRGFAYDEVNACMAAGWSNLVDLEARLVRVQNLRTTPDFEPLAASFKRIRNILDQAKFAGGGGVDPTLLEPGPEQELYDEYQRIAGQPIESVISRLRPKVDLFFDKVLVNAPDARVRLNRLTLLHTLLAEFSPIADFSEIVTHS
jgi:glycyl-tRNA synthetase beta chain